LQEPVSVALAALILAIQFHGWISFLLLVYYYLPLRPHSRKTYYEYTGLWHIYGFVSMNAWLWCAVFRTRDVEFTEKLYCSSYVAWLGFTLVLSTLRAFDIRDEAARVMIAAPVIAFVTSHILYLNLYNFDKGLNTKVTMVMTLVQMLIWVIWVGISRHPSRWKVWVTVLLGGTFAMTLEAYNFPSLQRYVDGRAMWHASAIPLGYMWWSFVKDDAEFRTSTQINKAK
ncbi:Post-GPI attachment to proteins factor 3, partial [Linum grandiflorum]